MLKFIDCSLGDIYREVEQGRTLICFGKGGSFRDFFDLFHDKGLEKYISAIADNGMKPGDLEYVEHTDIPVCSLPDILEKYRGPFFVLITSRYIQEIYEQLKKNPRFEDGVVAFYLFVMENRFSSAEKRCKIVYEKEIKIPKVIHYCWFGRAPLPSRYKEWMKSWKKFCPDYEVVEWNEDNYDVYSNSYMAEAYEARKWGFVPDYARLDIIYRYGGIYLDTDVELVRNLDPLLHQKAFMGFEGDYVALGLGFGAIAKHHALKGMRDDYDGKHFRTEDGTLNLVASPVHQTKWLKRKGLIADNTFQTVEDINIYPKSYFSPMNICTKRIVETRHTFSIHHFDGSWLNDEEKEKAKVIADFYRTYVSTDYYTREC